MKWHLMFLMEQAIKINLLRWRWAMQLFYMPKNINLFSILLIICVSPNQNVMVQVQIYKSTTLASNVHLLPMHLACRLSSACWLVVIITLLDESRSHFRELHRIWKKSLWPGNIWCWWLWLCHDLAFSICHPSMKSIVPVHLYTPMRPLPPCDRPESYSSSSSLLLWCSFQLQSAK